MQFSTRFYRGAAIASVLSAITTCGLVFLPRLYQPVTDFDARMALGTNTAYVVRSWIYLAHPFLVFTAILAVAARCRARAPGAALLGLAGFALWAATEAAQQALTKVALDRTWRAAWPAADDAAREVIRNHVAFYDVAWDAMFLLLLLGFFAGSVFIGTAVAQTAQGEAPAKARMGSLAMWVAAAFWAGGALTLAILSPELGGPALPGPDWLEAFIQPAGRTLIGVWLWREATTESTRRRRS